MRLLVVSETEQVFFDGVFSTFIISNSILLLFCFFSSDLFQNRLMVAVENHLVKYVKTKNPNQRGCKSLWDFVCRQNEDSKRTIDNQTELQPVLILQI